LRGAVWAIWNSSTGRSRSPARRSVVDPQGQPDGAGPRSGEQRRPVGGRRAALVAEVVGEDADLVVVDADTGVRAVELVRLDHVDCGVAVPGSSDRGGGGVGEDRETAEIAVERSIEPQVVRRRVEQPLAIGDARVRAE